ncbi:uncharacterized protein [Prorops nasuta]|uniref:uncharacterized protein n=1 Tax=Prorops nasuta TaxID=863751 RepID=UPI0034CEB4EB
MHIFPLNFFVLSIAGMWRPVSWTSRPKVILYSAYSFFILMVLWSFCAVQFIHLVLNKNDFKEVAITIQEMLLAIILVAFKGTVWILRHTDIIKLIDRFLRSPMKPENTQEKEIQLKFYSFTRKLSIIFTIWVFCLILAMIAQTTVLLKDGILLAPCWYPYDISQPKYLALTWMHHSIVYFNGGLMNASCDIIFPGLLLNICNQLEILKLRFHQLTRIQQNNNQLSEDQLTIQERQQLIICVKHHIHIFKYARELNKIFSPILFGHFFIHILLICSIIYQLSVEQQSVIFLSNLLYLSIVFAQVFFYCWFGNEVILSSLDFSSAIYSMDWGKLTLRGQKDLLIVLLRTKTPIKFTSSFLVNLSNDSFVNIIKASYSVFNLMRRTNTVCHTSAQAHFHLKNLDRCMMHILTEGFFVLSCVGIWRPVTWESSSKVVLYNAYTVSMLLLIYGLAVGQFIHLLYYVRNFDDFTDTTLMMMSALNLVVKGTVFSRRREDIIKLSRRFLKHPLKPLNQKEGAIQLEFDNFARKMIIAFAVSIIIIASAMIVQSLRTGVLLSPCWYPYDMSKPKFLAISWIHQIIIYVNGAPMDACCDTIFAGLLLKICSQLEILKVRFHRVIDISQNCLLNEKQLYDEERKSLISCIEHHKHILKYTRDLNQIFSPILFGQFFFGILLICSVVHHISITKPDMNFIPLIMYLVAVFAEVFFYCWFGNEVILKSSDLTNAIFEMDWTALTLRGQKDLIIILLRTKTPIKITSSFLVTLSNDSFITILKASYSIFNLIRERSD